MRVRLRGPLPHRLNGERGFLRIRRTHPFGPRENRRLQLCPANTHGAEHPRADIKRARRPFAYRRRHTDRLTTDEGSGIHRRQQENRRDIRESLSGVPRSGAAVHPRANRPRLPHQARQLLRKQRRRRHASLCERIMPDAPVAHIITARTVLDQPKGQWDCVPVAPFLYGGKSEEAASVQYEVSSYGGYHSISLIALIEQVQSSLNSNDAIAS